MQFFKLFMLFMVILLFFALNIVRKFILKQMELLSWNYSEEEEVTSVLGSV